ncbi:MAG TPA: GNAT family N-acetyltransferase [Terriglobales bacterium]|nr:GNAT family N-acetyltransferase [Terriglobales bacterium]
MSEIVEVTTPEQIEQVRNLFAEYRAQLPVEYCFRSFDAEIAGLPGVYGPPKGTLLLAMVVGQPVGCVGLRPFPADGACEMKRLYVRPGFRGSKLGQKLVDELLRRARVLGYASMRLDTHPPTMSAALDMYRKLGFREVSAGPGEAVEGLIYMELALNAAD